MKPNNYEPVDQLSLTLGCGLIIIVLLGTLVFAAFGNAYLDQNIPKFWRVVIGAAGGWAILSPWLLFLWLDSKETDRKIAKRKAEQERKNRE